MKVLKNFGKFDELFSIVETEDRENRKRRKIDENSETRLDETCTIDMSIMEVNKLKSKKDIFFSDHSTVSITGWRSKS